MLLSTSTSSLTIVLVKVPTVTLARTMAMILACLPICVRVQMIMAAVSFVMNVVAGST